MTFSLSLSLTIIVIKNIYKHFKQTTYLISNNYNLLIDS